MSTYIDVSVLMITTFVTGIQRVTREVSLKLIEREPSEIRLLQYSVGDESFHIIDNDRFYNYFEYGKGSKHRIVSKDTVDIHNVRGGDIWFDLDASWMGKVKRSWLLPILKNQGCRIIGHIYDIISVTHPQYCMEQGVYYFADYIGAHLLYDSEMIVNAEATLNELERLAKKAAVSLPKCNVVYLGANFDKTDEIDISQVSPSIATRIRHRKYILMVGTLEPRKNHKLVLDAYDGRCFDGGTKSLREQGYDIIMAGYLGWNMKNFYDRLINHPDYNKRIFHFEGLGDIDISYLYKNCEYLVFSSYTEGFGLPIIEAINKGARVVCADVPVLREIGGNKCLWFKQDDAQDLASVIEKDVASGKPIITEKVDINAFSWNNTTEEILKILRR